MKYKIWCVQRQTYFGDNPEFDSLEEIREQLISYHSNDMSSKDLDTIKRMSLAEILSFFEWEVHNDKEEFVEV